MRRASSGPPVTEDGSPRHRLTSPFPPRIEGSRDFGGCTTTVSFFFGPARFGPARRVLDRPAPIATLSEAVPTTVTSSGPTIAPSDGERIVTCGAILSGRRTVTDRLVVSTSPYASRTCKVTAYVPAVVKT